MWDGEISNFLQSACEHKLNNSNVQYSKLSQNVKMNNKLQYTNLYPTAFLYTSIFKNYIVQLNIPCVITLYSVYLFVYM